MKRLFVIIMVGAALVSCHNETGYKKAEDAQDAAREFIRASLDGDYNKADFYLYKDSSGTNEMLMNTIKSKYEQRSPDEKAGHKTANIIVIKTEPLGDSALNFVYSNSYKKDTSTIHVIKANGEWLVDLKKTFIKD